MNTVLDDNKKLCLSSGEIIKLTPSQKMIFEVENLAYASPATVSRCGMVYLEPSALGLQPLLLSWLQGLRKNKLYVPEQALAAIIPGSALASGAAAPTEVLILGMNDFDQKVTALFESVVPVAIEFIRKQGPPEKVPTMNSNLVQSLFRLFDCLVNNAKNAQNSSLSGGDEGNNPVPAQNEADNGTGDSSLKWPVLLEPFFYFGLIWSIGASFGLEGREKFDKFVRGVMHKNNVEMPFPSSGLVYDYKFDAINMKWDHFIGESGSSSEIKIDPRLSFSEIIVPTIDSIRNTYLLDLLMTCNMHVLCLGTTGTAKTVTITEKLIKGMPADKYTPICINFSARTSANQTQDLLDGKMDKRRKVNAES